MWNDCTRKDCRRGKEKQKGVGEPPYLTLILDNPGFIVGAIRKLVSIVPHERDGAVVVVAFLVVPRHAAGAHVREVLRDLVTEKAEECPLDWTHRVESGLEERFGNIKQQTKEQATPM